MIKDCHKYVYTQGDSDSEGPRSPGLYLLFGGKNAETESSYTDEVGMDMRTNLPLATLNKTLGVLYITNEKFGIRFNSSKYMFRYFASLVIRKVEVTPNHWELRELFDPTQGPICPKCGYGVLTDIEWDTLLTCHRIGGIDAAKEYIKNIGFIFSS